MGLHDPAEAARWPLTGRAAAYEALTEVLAGEAASSIVIAGPAGVGRTRLAREALMLAGRARPVRWAAATESAALVPLGAFTHLLPSVEPSPDPFLLLHRATHAIAGDQAAPRPVLGVDDVHLLDPLSITLLHQLAVSGAVSLVLTVRTGDTRADAVAPLWKDGLATRLDLHPLSRAETHSLLDQVLGAPTESRTGERLWRLTSGNPLFLREVLAEGHRTRQLHRVAGLWRWEGPMTPSTRLCEIVRAQLRGLAPEELRALEVLAAAGPLPPEQLVGLSSREAVATLERRGLIVADAGSTSELHPTEPLHAAVLSVRVSEATMRPLRRQLAEGGIRSPGTPDQVVRRCLALVESGLPLPAPAVLVRAARWALAAHDLPTAQRLGRAAAGTGGGVGAHLVLQEAVRWLGEVERSQQVAAAALPVAGTDLDRARLIAARVLTLAAGQGRCKEAVDVLAEGARLVRSARGRLVLDAAEGIVDLLGGDLSRAAGRFAVARAEAPPGSTARLLAQGGEALRLALEGHTGEALDSVEQARGELDATAASEQILTNWLLDQAEVIALHLTGRLEELDRRVAERHQQALADREWVGDAVATLHRGWAALAAGRPREADRWLAETELSLGHQDPLGFAGLARSLRVMALALLGEAAAARALLDEAGDLGPAPVFEPVHELARACLEAAEGRRTDARRHVLRAAARAASDGQRGLEVLILHRGLRWGLAPLVAPRLRELVARVDDGLVGDLAAHAEAVAAGDAPALEEVSLRLERAGAVLAAADAASDAAAEHERQGARRAAAEWRTRTMVLLRSGGLADVATGTTSAPLPTLTLREEEIALLALRGLSNQGIADRLVLSVRTVEAHLSHVYTKFGITSRAELADALEAGARLPSPRRSRSSAADPLAR